MDREEELALVNTLLRQAAGNGGVAEWQEGQHKVKHYSIRELLDWRDRLENDIYQSTNGITMPVTDAIL